MNKWQIICPVVAMLIAGMFVGLIFSRNQEKAFRTIVESQLGSVLKELESLQEGGRLPSVRVAQEALNDGVVAKGFHTSSMFDTADLFYNPSQPLVGSDALVLCVRVNNRLFAIYANRKVQVLGENGLRQARLVPLAKVPSKT